MKASGDDGGGGELVNDACPAIKKMDDMMGPKGPIVRGMPKGVSCTFGITDLRLWTYPRCTCCEGEEKCLERE